MTTVEVLFKVGNAATYAINPNTAYADGAVLMARPRGYAWSPAVVDAYLTNGTIPPNWSSLANWQQETIKRMLDRVNWLSQPGRTTAEVISKRPGATVQEAQDLIDEAGAMLTQWSTLGYDTNWGEGDLMSHGVILLDLTDQQILLYYEDFQQPPIATGLDPVAERQIGAKSRWRVRYESIFDAATVADLQDPSVLVPVPRGMTPLTPAQALEAVPVGAPT